MPKLLILDPCYHKIGGHHHDVNVNLVQRLSHFDVSIQADSRLLTSDAQKEYKPKTLHKRSLRNVGYVGDDLYSTIPDFYKLANKFALQLRNLDCDVLVAHTLMHFHLMGLGMRMHRTTPKRIIVSQMFSPFEGLRATPNNKLDYYLTMQALKCLNQACIRRSHQVTIGITSEFHWELYQEARDRYTFLDFQKCPWLVGCHNKGYSQLKELNPKADRQSKKKIVLYLGDAKEDKGLYHVRDLLKHLDKRHQIEKTVFSGKLEFYLCIGSADDWLLPLVEEIQEISERNRDLIVFQRSRLSSDSLIKILASSDAIVFLYDPVKYEFRTSGIFYEALSSWYHYQTRPCLIVTEGSWMQREARLLKLDVLPIDTANEEWMQSLLLSLSTLQEDGVKKPFGLQTVEPYVAKDFAAWIKDQIGTKNIQLSNILNHEYSHRSTLIIATNYPHFSTLSGPTGFAAYLDHSVQLRSDLGRSLEYDSIRSFVGLRTATDSALKLEIEILKQSELLPPRILCVDGEHSGALVAKAIQSSRLIRRCRLFSWFHQPASILRNQIIDVTSFPVMGLKPICISPCQVKFFEHELGYKEGSIPVIPHGIHRHLLEVGKLSYKSKLVKERFPLNRSLQFLTVGAWQRDRKLLLKTAKAFPHHQFLWISSGLQLNPDELRDARELSNIKILADGVSNHDLYMAYHNSDILFQPLIDATANNAILEAMAHGLPIITRDLESTRWYLNDNAFFYTDNLTCWEYIESLCRLSMDRLESISASLLQRANQLEWKKIADLFDVVLGSDA